LIVGWAVNIVERSASDDQGARDGAEAAVSRRLDHCIHSDQGCTCASEGDHTPRRPGHRVQHESPRSLRR